MVKVGIVVVTYNRLELLKEVIQSLREQTFKNRQIIVINNGSTDNTSEYLSEQSDIITITQDNLGGAGGFHTGLKYVAENGFNYCWLMDDDVICRPDALAELIHAFQSRPEIGYVCSKVVGIDRCPMNTPAVDDRPTSNGYADYCDMIGEQMIKVKQSTFVSVLVSTSTIMKVGLPYKEFFIWGDDTEYTSRISALYPCYMACRSVVLHKRSLQRNLDFMQEQDEKRLRNYFYYFRNNLFILRKRQGEKSFRNDCRSKQRLAIRRYLRGDKVHASILWKAVRAARTFRPQILFPSVR